MNEEYFSELNGYIVKDKQAIHTYDSIASMKADTKLKEGYHVKTKGYYQSNDGGHAEYIIVNDSTLVDDGGLIHVLTNGLRAQLIIENATINIRQLGARPQDSLGNKYDIKNYIDNYLSIQSKIKSSLKLYIPYGIWATSGNQLFSKYGIHIEGDEKFSSFHTFANGTIITTYNDNQSYIFQLGNTNNICHNWVLKNLIFSSSDFVYENDVFNFGNLKTVTKALELHYAEYGISDNLFFLGIKGNCLTINSSWENYFKLLNFRKVSNENGSIINFETKDTNLGTANITANTFEKIMFEKFHGNLMNFEGNSAVYNNHFGVINIEDGVYNIDGREYTTFTDEILASWDDTDCVHYALINFEENGQLCENVFDSIELNNYSTKYYTYNEVKYVYDTVIKYATMSACNNIFNNISLNGMNKDCKVIYLPATVGNIIQSRQFNTFNNFATDSGKNFIFDVKGLDNINVSENAYMFGNASIYSASLQDMTYFKKGGWLSCFDAKTKRAFPSGKGLLYYDKDSINPLRLVVIPRTDNFDRSFLNTIVNPSKKLYIRAKIPNEQVGKINVTNKTNTENIVYTFNGTGSYEVYEIELTNTWNVGDIINVTLAGSGEIQRIMSLDCYLSV